MVSPLQPQSSPDSTTGSTRGGPSQTMPVQSSMPASPTTVRLQVGVSPAVQPTVARAAVRRDARACSANRVLPGTSSSRMHVLTAMVPPGSRPSPCSVSRPQPCWWWTHSCSRRQLPSHVRPVRARLLSYHYLSSTIILSRATLMVELTPSGPTVMTRRHRHDRIWHHHLHRTDRRPHRVRQLS